jgi:hypothetical protein
VECSCCIWRRCVTVGVQGTVSHRATGVHLQLYIFSNIYVHSKRKCAVPFHVRKQWVHIMCSAFRVLELCSIGMFPIFPPPYRMSSCEVAIVMIDTERGREVLNVGQRFALVLPDRVLPKLGAKATRDSFDERVVRIPLSAIERSNSALLRGREGPPRCPNRAIHGCQQCFTRFCCAQSGCFVKRTPKFDV